MTDTSSSPKTEAADDIQPRSHGYPFDLAVFIGRFQPFHYGHLGVIKDALKQANRVLVLVGSVNRRPDTRNPFTYGDRVDMIMSALDDPQNGVPNAIALKRIEIVGIPDTAFDNRWLEWVQHAVRRATIGQVAPEIALTGHERDATSEYLKLFPQWAYIPANDTQIEATEIRKAFFAGGVDLEKWFPSVVPRTTISALQWFRDRALYATMMDAQRDEVAYRDKYGQGPFQTADAMLVQSGHILLIERPDGSFALPGGFLNPDETLYACALRELREETKIGLSREALRNAFRARERFDDPHRSRRARLITEAFAFKLPDDHRLPAVMGADDAKRAFWLPLSEVHGDKMFEDHALIIEKMLTLIEQGPRL